MLNIFKKKRQYPIIKDDRGRSIRARCFGLFNKGKRPMEISRELGAKPRTVLTYFAQWKKEHPNLQEDYPVFKETLKTNPELKLKIAQGLARELSISEDEAIERLEKPWAIKQAMRGTWLREKKQKDEQLRLEAARSIVFMVEKAGVTLPKIAGRLRELIQETQNKDDEKTTPTQAIGSDKFTRTQ